MAKLAIVHDEDPGIAVIFTEGGTEAGAPELARGWHGRCTECGPSWSMHRWHQADALRGGERHIGNVHSG